MPYLSTSFLRSIIKCCKEYDKLHPGELDRRTAERKKRLAEQEQREAEEHAEV